MSSITQSDIFHSVQARAVVSSPASTSSSILASGTVIENPTVTSFTATCSVPAAALVNGFLRFKPTAGPSTYTLPTAAEILTAFEDAGTALRNGNSFEVKVQSDMPAATPARSSILVLGANTVAGNSIEPILLHVGGHLVYVYSSATGLFTVFSSVSAS
jgi:hypothetical protein